MQKHWLILLGLILSASILTFGNIAYQKTITQKSHSNDQIIVKTEASANYSNVTNNQNQVSKKKEDNNKTLTSTSIVTIAESAASTKTTTSDPSPTQTPTANSTPLQQPTPTLTPAPPAQTQTQETKPEQKIVNLSIQGVKDYQVDWQDNDTAWTIMLRAAAKYHFAMSYQKFAIGVYISRLGDKDAQGTYYWALYYNGSYSMQGVSDLKVQSNDTISWKYEGWM